MNLLFAGFDLAAAKNLIMVAQAAQIKNHQVTFIGNQLMSRFIIGDKPDAIITGLASFKTENELIFATMARDSKIPHLVIAETHFSWARPKAEGLMTHAICAVASPAEIAEAKKWGYSDAVYLGGPPLWQAFRRLKPAQLVIPEDTKVILVGGIKDARLTDMMLAEVAKSIKALAATHGIKLQLIFRPHPNEPAETYNEARRKGILEGVEPLPSDAPTDNLISEVDVSIFTSGAMGTIIAPILRKPSIYYEDDWVCKRMVSQIGRKDWLPAEEGALIKATPETLTAELEWMLKLKEKELSEHHEQLSACQAGVYPDPKPLSSPEEEILFFIEKTWQN
ncbi:hypothetical protein KKF32_00270 [Patescibacteria group bacterium]|nr:hypothetical protein [Patescibacteria group bacterium]